ncbi:PIKK family atypical protein kinase [Tritrichomonas foetus]|uniref:Serine/threonine-protein kinase ATR n=1 Tax=Tritrichomonas foetus TaxID=1144522 RepID=A0A1J4KI00_9EUKA|nr:PIKK family atypical protein kinase [Tritrichomonas foetus]|eukprot:OHT11015.1 PIKK family atypical protein kinase [Tritrichomonas foetus]
MTQPSILSSAISLDEESLNATVTNIKFLMEKFFDNLMPLDESLDPINALFFVCENQRSIFRERRDSFYSTINSLYYYTIKKKMSPISQKNANTDYYKFSKTYIKLLSSMILCLRAGDLHSYISSFLLTLKNSVNNEDFYYPAISGPQQSYPFGGSSGNGVIAEVFLQILYKVISHVIYGDFQILDTLYDCLRFNELPVQYLALKCLSKIHSLSVSNAFIKIRIILFYAQKKLHEIVKEFPKSDQFVVRAFKNALSIFSKDTKILIGRDLLGYLYSLPNIANLDLMNQIFELIDLFFKADHADCHLSASIFLRTFKIYHENKMFIKLCRKISDIDINFRNELKKKYGDDESVSHSLIKVIPDFVTVLHGLSKPGRFSCPIFYKIFATLGELSNEDLEKSIEKIPSYSEIVEWLSESILNTSLPDKELLKPLMKFAGDAIMEKLLCYDLDTIYDVLFYNTTQLKGKYTLLPNIQEQIITKALEKQPYPLLSYFALLLREDRLISILKSTANDLESYKHKTYIDALASIFHEKVNEIIPNDIVLRLMNEKQFKSIQILANKEATSQLFLEQILKIMESDTDFNVASAFSLLKTIPFDKLNDIINLNRFMFAKAFFDLSRKSDTLDKFDIYADRFKCISNTVGLSLPDINRSLIPILISEKDNKSIDDYIAKILPEKRKHKEYKKEMILDAIADSFSYLLSYCEPKERKDCFIRLQELTNTPPFLLASNCITKLAFYLLLYLGHPNSMIKQRAKDGIVLIAKVMNQDLKNENRPEIILSEFWKNYFMSTMHHFSVTLNEKNNSNKLMVINSLISSLKYLAPNLNKIYPKLTSVVDMAIQNPKLCELCIRFWKKFFEFDIDKDTLKHLFGHVISQVVPYYCDYKEYVKKILYNLIIKNLENTREFFPEIATISIFSEYEELEKFNIALKQEHKKLDWNHQIKMLINQLDQASPPFRKQLLKQLLIHLKEHDYELSSISDNLLSCLWKIASHESNTELLILCGRCMGMLPYAQDATRPEIELIDRNDENALIVSLIKDFLVKVLEDSSNVTHHDHAAFSIQELLKRLTSNAQDKNTKSSTNKLEMIPENIRNVVEPFLYSKFQFTYVSPSDCEYKSSYDRQVDLTSWLSTWTSSLFTISDPKSGSRIFYCLECVLRDSPALTRFILPYLIAYNSTNNVFLEGIRCEWKQVYNDLKQPSDNKASLAKSAMRIFFQIFDVLNRWNIAAGSVHDRGKWISLNIADDYDLAVAAYECELYPRSLQHLEFHIYEKGNKKDNMNFLNIIYQKLDEPDSKLAFNKIDKNIIVDESLSSKEIMYLDQTQDERDIIPYISEMLRNGRHERALTDSLALKRKLMEDNVKLDAIISSASVRLVRWDELSKIADKEIKSTDDNASLVNISVGKLLYFLNSSKYTEFKNELFRVRSYLARILSTTSMISYHKLIPILSKFRAIEEVEEFSKSSGSNLFNFSEWNKQTILSVDDAEFITAVRCALIDISNCSEMKGNIYKNWLQLAKMNRKSESLFRSEMFCARAKYYTKSTEECDIEMAKILYAKQHSDQAMAVLKSIQIDSKDIQGNIIYTRAKWCEEINSEDSAKIISMYQKSVNLQHENIKEMKMNEINIPQNAYFRMAKAYFSLAALADQRATSFIQFIEETSDSSAQQQRRSRSAKFWNSSSPQSIAIFLKEQIPMALDNYLNCIKYSPQYSFEVVPRILLLFFDGGRYFIPDVSRGAAFDTLSKNQKEQILQAMKESMLKVDDVSSLVWQNAITQLISRVDQPKGLEDILFKLIKISVVDYPEQSIWHLMSISHSKVPTRSPKFEFIWDYIRKNVDSSSVMREIETIKMKLTSITTQLINLCSLQTGSYRKTTKASTLCPKLVSEFRDCHILMPLLSTLTTNVNGYRPKIKIDSMGEEIIIFQSLQKPRKIMLNAEGQSYHYLCKKDDDLRKDMRMMEFASFINRILANDRRCRQRDLAIVTYAVICLNEVCGMMEWVENTRSFRNVVNEMLEYRGIKIDYNKIKEIYIDVDKLDQHTIAKKRSNFTKIILPMFPPVLHCWFASHFTDVSRWFQSRLLYTRSTAVWSMVGYIIGLGDRHAENILLNEKTGSCVHVDFNCMFDRSKSLPIPEVVPFRLTQNIIDGMGVLNTSGSFTATSSLVMETLREKKTKLISVLQPFVHDPLVEWIKGNKATTESTAKLTLKEVERRLAGLSDDRSTILSPECIVKELIKQSSDPGNLSLMYIGWQSYL